jgi:uncharacterized membrane protein (UPF0127 family)
MLRILLAILVLASTALAQDVAQPPLPTITLTAENGRKITAEVADDMTERATGLMFREKLAPDSGMLFVMPKPDRAGFWMKNTLIPLSIAYINSTGTILEIHDMKPHNEKPVASLFPTVAYALEMEQGWFSDAGVGPGDRIKGLPPLTGK